MVVDITDTFDKMVAMLHCHQSQFYEWLPSNAGYLAEVPTTDADRRRWLRDQIVQRVRPLADQYRELINYSYGAVHGNSIAFVDAFQVSEFGNPLSAAICKQLFPCQLDRVAAQCSVASKQWVDIPVPFVQPPKNGKRPHVMQLNSASSD